MLLQLRLSLTQIEKGGFAETSPLLMGIGDPGFGCDKSYSSCAVYYKLSKCLARVERFNLSRYISCFGDLL